MNRGATTRTIKGGGVASISLLRGHSDEPVAGLGVDVGEALGRAEALWLRSQVLKVNLLAESSRLGQR